MAQPTEDRAVLDNSVLYVVAGKLVLFGLGCILILP
jgi:hypothetical protein